MLFFPHLLLKGEGLWWKTPNLVAYKGIIHTIISHLCCKEVCVVILLLIPVLTLHHRLIMACCWMTALNRILSWNCCCTMRPTSYTSNLNSLLCFTKADNTRRCEYQPATATNVSDYICTRPLCCQQAWLASSAVIQLVKGYNGRAATGRFQRNIPSSWISKFWQRTQRE